MHTDHINYLDAPEILRRHLHVYMHVAHAQHGIIRVHIQDDIIGVHIPFMHIGLMWYVHRHGLLGVDMTWLWHHHVHIAFTLFM